MFMCVHIHVCMHVETRGQPWVSFFFFSGAIHPVFPLSYLIIFIFNYTRVCISVCGCVHVCTESLRTQRCLVPLELELEAVVGV